LDTRSKGGRAEDEAARYLENKGHRIVERNIRAGRGEIDLVTRDGATLVFVEVKSGASTRFGDPEDRVDRRKQRRLGMAASAYLEARGMEGVDCRLDVVAVVLRD
jgi:putative endonuclease